MKKINKMFLSILGSIGIASAIVTPIVVNNQQSNTNIISQNSIQFQNQPTTFDVNSKNSRQIVEQPNWTNSHPFNPKIYPNIDSYYQSDQDQPELNSLKQLDTNLYFGWEGLNWQSDPSGSYKFYSGYTLPGIVVVISKPASINNYAGITNIVFYPNVMLKNKEQYDNLGINIDLLLNPYYNERTKKMDNVSITAKDVLSVVIDNLQDANSNTNKFFIQNSVDKLPDINLNNFTFDKNIDGNYNTRNVIDDIRSYSSDGLIKTAAYIQSGISNRTTCKYKIDENNIFNFNYSTDSSSNNYRLISSIWNYQINNITQIDIQNIFNLANNEKPNANFDIYYSNNQVNTNELINSLILPLKNNFFDYLLVATGSMVDVPIFEPSSSNLIIENPVLNNDFSIEFDLTTNVQPIQKQHYKIINFTNLPAATSLKNNTIEWNSDNYRNIFSGISPFIADWKNNSNYNTYTTKLKGYVNDHINDFFNSPFNTQISNIIAKMQDDCCIFDITFNGANDQQIDSKMKGQFTVYLKPNPTSDQIFDGLEDYLIKNNGTNPLSDQQLKNAVAEYLNTQQRDNLPNAWKPSSGSFAENDIQLDTSKINYDNGTTTTNGSITIQQGAISINPSSLSNNNQIVLNDINTTHLNKDLFDAQQNDELKNLSIDEAVSKIDSTLISTIISSSVINGPSSLNIINPTTQISNTDLIINFDISNANLADGTSGKKSFTIKINHFNPVPSTTNTTLKITDIKYGDSTFTTLFGNDKGFSIDWANNYVQQINDFTTHINENIDTFFDSPATSTQVSGVSFDIAQISSNIVIAKFSFNGYVGGQEEPINNQQITINLRSFDSKQIEGQINQGIQNWVDNHPNQKPSDQDLNNIISNVFNSNQQNIPNVYLPQTPTIDQNKISVDSNGNVSFQEGAITINSIPSSIPGFNNSNITLSAITFNSSKPITNISNNINENWYICLIATIGISLLIILSLLVLISVLRKKYHIKSMK